MTTPQRADFAATLAQIEEHLRSGQMKAARTQLEGALKLPHRPRNMVWQLAALSRRLGLLRQSVRLLTPVMREASEAGVAPLPDEEIEFAAALTRFGLLKRAREILHSSLVHQHPRARVFLAFTWIKAGEYGQGIQELHTALASPELSEYDHWIARTNLGMALILNREHDQAQQSLITGIRQLEQLPYRLLLANHYDLVTQNALWLGDIERAEEWISKGLAIGSDLASLDSLALRFANLNLALLKAKRADDKIATQNCLKELESLAADSAHQGYFETAFECVHLRARITQEPEVIARLYWGSSRQSFRDLLVKDFPAHCRHFTQAPTAPWRWIANQRRGQEQLSLVVDSTVVNSESVEDATVPAAAQLDLVNFTYAGKPLSLRPGQLLARLLIALLADAFRPPTLFELQEALDARTMYDLNSGETRMRQLLRRLRAWLRKEKIPLRVVQRDLRYYVFSSTNRQRRLMVRLPKNALHVCSTPYDPNHRDLRKELSSLQERTTKKANRGRPEKTTTTSRPHSTFDSAQDATWLSPQELQKQLRRSERSTQRWIRMALRQKLLEKIGRARATRYRLSRSAHSNMDSGASDQSAGFWSQ